MALFKYKIGNGDQVVYTDESLHKEMKQRAKRNSLLADSDSMMVSDRGLSDEKKASNSKISELVKNNIRQIIKNFSQS